MTRREWLTAVLASGLFRWLPVVERRLLRMRARGVSAATIAELNTVTLKNFAPAIADFFFRGSTFLAHVRSRAPQRVEGS